MSTVAEIREAIAKLTTQELRQVKEAVRGQYRTRNAGVIYDDIYGMWTEEDQASTAAAAFALMDQEEARNERSKAR